MSFKTCMKVCCTANIIYLVCAVEQNLILRKYMCVDNGTYIQYLDN